MKAGSAGALIFRLLQGESDDPADNLSIGLFKITGADFDDGVIPAGAKLQCDPFIRDWSASKLAADLGISEVEAETIYYYGAEVVPCSIHAVQQATQSCVDSASKGCFSDPLEVGTALWGDIWEPFGSVNFTDIGQEVNAFKSIPYDPGYSGAPGKWRAMLRGNEGMPGSAINFTDIGKTVEAFKAIAYLEDGPTDCP